MKSEIESIVESLKRTEETQWRDHIELLQDAIGEARRASAPRVPKDKTGTRSGRPRIYLPGTEKMRAAFPHIDLMLSAMRRRNRAEAIESGTAALAALDGTVSTNRS